jgi:hypothetical protein
LSGGAVKGEVVAITIELEAKVMPGGSILVVGVQDEVLAGADGRFPAGKRI